MGDPLAPRYLAQPTLYEPATKNRTKACDLPNCSVPDYTSLFFFFEQSSHNHVLFGFFGFLTYFCSIKVVSTTFTGGFGFNGLGRKLKEMHLIAV
jgi:hypothetical protein